MLSSDASFARAYSVDSKATETNIEYDLEVEVSSNASGQEDTSDDAESEDAYASEQLADQNWLTQYKVERQKVQELDGLASVAIGMGVEEEACSLLLPQCFATGSTHKLNERCLNIFPDFPCLSCCCIQKQRINPPFSFLQLKQRLTQTKK